MTQTQQDVRIYGSTHSRVVVLHGGPGGAGEVEPLAWELERRGYAVLEPFQTCQSVSGQVDELRSQIARYCAPPVTVIGWSWGAWLGCLLAAQHKVLVRKLILVSSGPFEARYASQIRNTKNSRLSNEEQTELAALRPGDGDPAQVSRFIELSDLAETYERDSSPQPNVMFDGAIHASVWPEANAMRKSGALLDAVSAIRCPVFAIHGDYDPRPAEGVQMPLEKTLTSVDFVCLERCGHKPWQEINAKENFYDLLTGNIG